MSRFFALWRTLLFAAPLALWCLFPGKPALAQERLDEVVIMKSGREYVGYVTVDTVARKVRVRTPKGDEIRIDLDSVQAFSRIERVRESPLRPVRYETIAVELPWTCGRNQQWYFLELRAVGIKEEKLTFGGEVAAGFRFWGFSLGAGIARLQLLSKWRTPFFVHAKYHFSEGCVKPFVMLDAGFVSDTFTGKYDIRPSLRAVTERTSKMAGAGIGLDFALTKIMDISVDAGYRYFTLAEDRLAESCTQDVIVCGYNELHTAFLRVGVTF